MATPRSYATGPLLWMSPVSDRWDGIDLAAVEFLLGVKDFLLDLALPRTDRAVFIQLAVMIPFWVIVGVASRRLSKDARTFILGLAILNMAWFAVRTVH